MFIQTEDTPNPLTMKFVPGQDVSPGAPREFRTEDEAWASRWRPSCSRSMA